MALSPKEDDALRASLRPIMDDAYLWPYCLCHEDDGPRRCHEYGAWRRRSNFRVFCLLCARPSACVCGSVSPSSAPFTLLSGASVYIIYIYIVFEKRPVARGFDGPGAGAAEISIGRRASSPSGDWRDWTVLFATLVFVSFATGYTTLDPQRHSSPHLGRVRLPLAPRPPARRGQVLEVGELDAVKRVRRARRDEPGEQG